MRKKILLCLLFLSFNGAVGTLQKPSGRKPKKEKLLPGIAYNNKKLPDSCQGGIAEGDVLALAPLSVVKYKTQRSKFLLDLGRNIKSIEIFLIEKGSNSPDPARTKLVTDEITQLLKKGEKVDKEEEKRRKREKRRTGRISKSNRLIHSIMQDVCENMMNYLPQSDRTKFRYAHKTVLQDTAVLQLSLTQPGEANKLENKYDPYNHPETYRLKSECAMFIDKHKDDIINWSENISESEVSITEFLCKERLAKAEQVSMDCLRKDFPKESMWSKTFEILSESHVASRAEL